jgi:hypothetical protein
LVATVVKRQDSSLLRSSAPKQDLHLRIALADVNRTDDPGDHSALQAAYPYVDSVAVPRPEAGQIAVVERVDQLGNVRMCASPGSVDHDWRSRDE